MELIDNHSALIEFVTPTDANSRCFADAYTTGDFTSLDWISQTPGELHAGVQLLGLSAIPRGQSMGRPKFDPLPPENPVSALRDQVFARSEHVALFGEPFHPDRILHQGNLFDIDSARYQGRFW